MIDTVQESYNKLEQLPNIPALILSYLIDNNDYAFTLLYYNTPDAWNKGNITTEQKRSLIYNGTQKVEDARIFLDTGQDSAFVGEISILRISVLEFVPTNRLIGHVTVAVEVYCHYLINTLSNYTVRTDSIIQSVISTINGASINGITSRLYFDSSRNPRSKMMQVGASPFKGKVATLCSWAN